MKTKVANILRGKERKNRYAKLNRDRWRRCIYIKDWLQGEKNSKKGKQINKHKNIIGFNKLKL